MILFTKNTKHEVDDFFKGIDKRYTYCCGMELFTDVKHTVKLDGLLAIEL